MSKEIAYRTDAILHQAAKSIDALFGEGYAKEHPELVAGFMVSAANSTIAVALEEIAELYERNTFPV